jgi:hypothetical protein
MTDLLIRNVPEALVARLKEQARSNKRSLQGELVLVLDRAVRPSLAEWLEGTDALRTGMPSDPSFSDSTDLVRRDRDSR